MSGAETMNRSRWPLRDSNGTIRGGAYGATMWGWLMLEDLWIAAELRGRGEGARLLAAAEAAAR